MIENVKALLLVLFVSIFVFSNIFGDDWTTQQKQKYQFYPQNILDRNESSNPKKQNDQSEIKFYPPRNVSSSSFIDSAASKKLSSKNTSLPLFSKNREGNQYFETTDSPSLNNDYSSSFSPDLETSTKLTETESLSEQLNRIFERSNSNKSIRKPSFNTDNYSSSLLPDLESSIKLPDTNSFSPQFNRTRRDRNNLNSSDFSSFSLDTEQPSKFSFYNGSTSDGRSFSGSTNNIGQFGFHNLSDSDGNTLTGSSNHIGSYDFHNLSTNKGETISGSTKNIGNYQFHNFSSSNGRSVNGTSTQIGDFTFHNFSNSQGKSVNGTTTRIGNQTFTNWTEFEH